MLLTESEIKNKIKSENSFAISVDTSIFDRYRLNLIAKPLSSLAQLKNLKIQFILPDIILNEIKNHLVIEALNTRNKLKKIMNEIHINLDLELKHITSISEIINNKNYPMLLSMNKIEKYILESGIVIEEAKNYNLIEKLFNRYFDCLAPFSKSDKKKNEFPDAVALLTLESWAEKHNSFVLCVSEDKDWEAYCKDSERLIYINNLNHALAFFQNDIESIFFLNFIKENYSDLLNLLVEAANDQSYKMEYEIEACSQFHFEEGDITSSYELNLLDNNFKKEQIDIIEQTDDHISIKILFNVAASIQINYQFAKWDSIDKEYIPMGSNTFNYQESLTLEAIVTYFIIEENTYDLDQIDIIPQCVNLDIGDIDPGWMSEYGPDD